MSETYLYCVDKKKVMFMFNLLMVEQRTKDTLSLSGTVVYKSSHTVLFASLEAKL